MLPKVLIDTNVLMDVLLGTRQSSKASRSIFNCVREGRLEGVIVMQSVVDAAYGLRKEGEEAYKHFQGAILDLFRYFNDDTASYFDVKYACMQSSGDFEDNVLYSRAQATVCDAIVTNDRKFRKKYEGKDRHIRFFTPEELLAEMFKDQTSAQ
jgi:predicted nucleic acid-binding protein